MFAIAGNNLVKWHADGSVDAAFGGDGVVEPTSRSFLHLALDPNGDVVVVGFRFGGAATGWAGRFDGTTGAPDTTFGAGGAVEFAGQLAQDVVVDAAGRPVVGLLSSASPSVSKVIRLQTDGAVDTTFGAGGTVTVPIPYVAAMAIDSAGRVAAASSNPIDMVRITTDGVLDPAFTRMYVTGFLQDLLVDPAGRLGPISSTTPVASRLLPDGGALDPTFGDAGKLSSVSQMVDPHGALDAGGRLIIVGRQGTTNDVAVARDVDGVLDTSFATGGGARLGPDLTDGRTLRASDRILVGADGGQAVVVARHGQTADLSARDRWRTCSDSSPNRRPTAPDRRSRSPRRPTGPPTCRPTRSWSTTRAPTPAATSTAATARKVGSTLSPHPGLNSFEVSALDLAGNWTTHRVEFHVEDAASTAVAAGGVTGTGDGGSVYIGIRWRRA